MTGPWLILIATGAGPLRGLGTSTSTPPSGAWARIRPLLQDGGCPVLAVTQDGEVLLLAARRRGTRITTVFTGERAAQR